MSDAINTDPIYAIALFVQHDILIDRYCAIGAELWCICSAVQVRWYSTMTFPFKLPRTFQMEDLNGSSVLEAQFSGLQIFSINI